MKRDEILKQLWELEEHYDHGSVEGSIMANPRAETFMQLLDAVRSARWPESYQEASRAFQECSTAIEKAFVLQWAVGASERQYNLQMREEWMARWKEIDGWAEDSYCRYLRMYQEALTRFFEGSLQEAEGRFQRAYEIALGTSYERGQMRCLFHLGLIQRDKSRFDQAEGFFHAALDLARKRKALSYGLRIEDQLVRIGMVSASSGDVSPERRKIEIEKRLLEHRFAEARSLIVEAEKARRRARLKRGRESYFIYLGFFMFSKKREPAASRMLHRISDPLLKIHVLRLKDRVFGLTGAEERELHTLQEIHGVASVMIRSSAQGAHEVCGISLDDIFDQEIRLLIELLLESESSRSGGLTKEMICSRLWRYSYDPTVHDGRLYKVIHKTRKFFAKKDLFLNTYGGYRLNPKFLGSSSVHMFQPSIGRRKTG